MGRNSEINLLEFLSLIVFLLFVRCYCHDPISIVYSRFQINEAHRHNPNPVGAIRVIRSIPEEIAPTVVDSNENRCN